MEIPDDTNESKVWQFLNLTTGALLNPDCSEACHPLPSEGKNKIILKFSRKIDVYLIMRNKNKIKHAKPSNINIPSCGKV